MRLKELHEEAPSAEMTTKEKSTVVKKAKAGKDISKMFKEVTKKAK